MAPKRRRDRAPIDTGDRFVILQNENGEAVDNERVLRIYSGFLRPEKPPERTVRSADETTEEDNNKTIVQDQALCTELRSVQLDPAPKPTTESTYAAPTETWPFAELRSQDIISHYTKAILTPPFTTGEVVPLLLQNNSRHHVFVRVTLNTQERVVILRNGQYSYRKVKSNIVQRPDGTCQRYGKMVLENVPSGMADGGPLYFCLGPGQSHSAVVHVRKVASWPWKYPETGSDVLKFEVVSSRPDIAILHKKKHDLNWPFEKAQSKYPGSLVTHCVLIYYAYVNGTTAAKDSYIWLREVEPRNNAAAAASVMKGVTEKPKDKK